MKNKIQLIIIAFMGCITLISVGFAAWIVAKPFEPVNDSFDIVVFEPMDNAKYIEIVESEVFDYYNTGFVENDSVITDTGKVTVKFNLKVSAYKESFENSTGMTIELLLKHASNNSGYYMFVEDSPFSFTPTVSEELVGTLNSTTTTKGCLLTIDLDSLPSNDVSFTVTFAVNFSGTYEEFKANVFPYLPGVRFAVEAKITSK